MASTVSPPPGPPYPPHNLGLGGTPTVIPDVPVSAVFLALFTCAAVAHMGLFQFNLHKRKKKFAFNAATFGFCFTRILATSLRISWSFSPHNIALGLAAQIFVYAGVPILFICNLFWAQRIVRAQHPAFGWSKPFSIWLPVLVVVAVLTIFALIAAIVVQFYVPGDYVQQWTRGIQLYGATLFGITAFLPIPIELISTMAKAHPKLKERAGDNFGSGSITLKITISIISAVFLSVGAWYRAGTSYLLPIPVGNPIPTYFSKPCFYVFNFTIEICVVYAWLLIRVDKHFVVPDGARRPYSYGNGFVFAGEAGNEKGELNDVPSSSTRHLTCASGDGFGSLAYYSVRSSTVTLPPPRLSRADSWGSMTKYMSTENLDKTLPSDDVAPLAAKGSYRRSLPPPRHSRADSLPRGSLNEMLRPVSMGNIRSIPAIPSAALMPGRYSGLSSDFGASANASASASGRSSGAHSRNISSANSYTTVPQTLPSPIIDRARFSLTSVEVPIDAILVDPEDAEKHDFLRDVDHDDDDGGDLHPALLGKDLEEKLEAVHKDEDDDEEVEEDEVEYEHEKSEKQQLEPSDEKQRPEEEPGDGTSPVEKFPKI